MNCRTIIGLLVLCVYAGCTERYYFDRAVQCERQANYTEAIGYLDKVIEKNAGNTHAYINRGADYAELGNYAQAIDNYTQALAIDSLLVVAYMNRAANLQQIEDYAAALQDYQAAYRCVGGTPQEQLIMLSAGEPTLPAFFGVQPSDDQTLSYSVYDIMYERGIVYYFLDSLPQALADFGQCIAHRQYVAESYYWRGFTYLKMGLTARGCANLNAAGVLGDQAARVDYSTYCGGGQ